MDSLDPVFNICKFCAINSRALCPYETMTDGMDEPLRGHMAQCDRYERPADLPPLGLWAARFAAVHYTTLSRTSIFLFPFPVVLFWHLARMDFDAALEFDNAQ
jgi:hypothetical protein